MTIHSGHLKFEFKIRNMHVSDFEFEFQMATMNSHLNSDVSTLLMVTSDKYVHINSTMVKNVSKLKGDIAKYVPSNVFEASKTLLGTYFAISPFSFDTFFTIVELI